MQRANLRRLHRWCSHRTRQKPVIQGVDLWNRRLTSRTGQRAKRIPLAGEKRIPLVGERRSFCPERRRTRLNYPGCLMNR
jgi:hypothetical protein